MLIFIYLFFFIYLFIFFFLGKRRTNRNSKDENAVIGQLDGPKGPKDSRLETRIVNGSIVGNKMSSGATHTDSKITNYFSPSRTKTTKSDVGLDKQQRNT
ncbi:hypothetical protein E2C01_080298 [Portunus trituberculatus]|uniref:Uncharacterized protein n=1 Tax=Portunus trituberculatus TaxID=210409 RepID=A0A5B7ITQ6_PORTR|nr:hypothetical protein [Portunus trituberculatus]